MAATATPAPTITLAYYAGWQLVSGPTGALVSGAEGRLFSIHPGTAMYQSLPVSTPLQACSAYWAYFPTGGTVQMALYPPTLTPCSVTLTAGQWAMVGNTSSTNPADVVGAQQSLTFVDGAYVPTTTVPAGSGVWVEGPGTITVGPPGTIPPPPPQ